MGEEAQALVRATNAQPRLVELRGEWWKRGIFPLLVLRQEDRATLLLLPDAQGRLRAEREVEALRGELEAIRIENADPEALDAAVGRMVELDRRLALLHEALATAASRSALAAE